MVFKCHAATVQFLIGRQLQGHRQILACLMSVTDNVRPSVERANCGRQLSRTLLLPCVDGWERGGGLRQFCRILTPASGHSLVDSLHLLQVVVAIISNCQHHPALF